MRRYSLEIIVFTTGAVVMILEITASRLLAPYMGTSLPVWTSIIGVILASLAAGYWLGGLLADKRSDSQTLAALLLMAAAWIAVIVLFNEPFLTTLMAEVKISLIFLSSIASLVILAAPSMLLGMISPYAVKLKLHELTTAGAVVGRLGALATIGSIIGTFSAGGFLLSILGTRSIFLLLALILALLSLLCGRIQKKQLITIVILLATLGVLAYARPTAAQRIDIDTGYSRIWIQDDPIIRTLYIGGVTNSAAFLDDPTRLVYPYTKFYRLAKHFMPTLQRSLMLGGGGYSYPKSYLREFPHATLEVVEIDPAVTAIAKKYFGLTDNPRLSIFHEDGRSFINRTHEKYDVIYGDAFGSYYSIPYQLTTLEAAQRTYDLLNPNGVTVINTISSLEGDTGKFFQAEYKTLKKVFPQVYIFPVTAPDPYLIQNIMLVALKGHDVLQGSLERSTDPELDDYLKTRWQKPVLSDLPILTDDFAPVDQYIAELL